MATFEYFIPHTADKAALIATATYVGDAIIFVLESRERKRTEVT